MSYEIRLHGRESWLLPPDNRGINRKLEEYVREVHARGDYIRGVLGLAVALISAPLSMLVPGTAAQSAKTVTKSATMTKPKKAKRAPTLAQQALHARMRKCGVEWKTAKAAGKIARGMKWPQYWSARNKRPKAGG